MNEQVKQRIKSSICSKDKWVLDKEVSNCFRCDKKFNPIFLRKHHCRVCGHIFCAAYFVLYADVPSISCLGRILIWARSRLECASFATRRSLDI